MNKIIILLLGICLITSCKDGVEEQQAQKIIELEKKLNNQEKEKLDAKDSELKLKEKILAEKEEDLNRIKKNDEKRKTLNTTRNYRPESRRTRNFRSRNK